MRGEQLVGQRISTHKIETKTRNNIRKIIDSGPFLFRELTERDYGIDAIIEYFNDEKVTGKIAFIQIKGTNSKIESLKSKPVVSCSISKSSALYALQTNIPVILVYASLQCENMFYFICLQEGQLDRDKLENQFTITVNIPIQNIIKDNCNELEKIIKSYY